MGGRFVDQLMGYTQMADVRLKVAFIEDSYVGMFPSSLKPVEQAAFIKEINQLGANFPHKAFLAGLVSMPWIAMMDAFEQIDFDFNNPYLIHTKPVNMMAMVRSRMQDVFKEMLDYG